MTVHWGLFGAFAAACLLCCGTAQAETRALIVGVSGYPNLPGELHLVGPRNDAREMANTLVRLGVPADDVTVLADGIKGLAAGIATPGIGTRKAVLADLDKLAATSKPGDLVVFYFSGHGSQQPDLNGDEEGGQDQVFLPYDVGRWEADGIENAIVDDELSTRVQAILDKGADFFGIIDACHSASGFRDLPGDETRVRGIDPALLGVPDDGEAGRGVVLARKPVPQGKGSGKGRAAFFYAAQTSESALEKMPPGAADGESYGVFTYTMLRRLNQIPGITYRTLHQAVVADIKRNTLMATQTPDLEGDLLDEPVLRLSKARTLRQWSIWNGGLDAGQLAGLSAGAILALYADPAAPDDKALAYGVIQSAGATRSVVEQIVYRCKDAVGADGSCPTALDQSAFRKGRFARLIEPGVDLSLVLSEPVRVDPQDGRDYAPALAALDAAIASPDLSRRVSVRSDGYDIAVSLVDGKLAFSATAGQFDADGPGSSPRLTLPDGPQAAQATVAAAIDRIARALALQRLGGGAAVKALGLETRVLIARARPQAVQGDGCSQDKADYAEAEPAGPAPDFGDCDILAVDMLNKGQKPADVTVLLIGEDFSITSLWPAEGTVNRLHPGDEKHAEIAQMSPHPATASRQRLVFLAVPGLGTSHTVFDNLDQEGLRAGPGEGVTPGAEAARALVSAGLNDMSRTAVAKPPRIEEEMSIDIMPFRVRKDP